MVATEGEAAYPCCPIYRADLVYLCRDVIIEESQGREYDFHFVAVAGVRSSANCWRADVVGVKVSEVNLGMAPPSHLLDSEIPQKPKSETGLRGDGETPVSSRRGDRETMMYVADGTIEVNFGD
ncbi:hypothetical protein Bca52824_087354 [Brassica carinata]|uniref:Uncharacterized protein n=2 Tax=Brassica TaxID=3705 RepID=A0A8X7TNJ0_BRACI|nr:hypothetical protein Bca52824_087354 [Brassica carinata]